MRKRSLSRAYYTRELFGLFILGFALYFRTDNFREIIIKLLQVYMTPPVKGKEKKERKYKYAQFEINELKSNSDNINIVSWWTELKLIYMW